MAHARRARYWARESIFGLGPRSRHLSATGIPRQPRRSRSRTRHHRRRGRWFLQLCQISRRLARRSSARAQARRHHRLFRHRTFHVRLRLRYKLADDPSPACTRLDRPRQPRPLARRVTRRCRSAGQNRQRLRLRARHGHGRRSSRPALRYRASGNLGRSRSSTCHGDSRRVRRASVCNPRSRRKKTARTPRTKLHYQPQATPAALLEISRWRFRARPGRFRAHSINSARVASSYAAVRRGARRGNFGRPLHLSQFHRRRRRISRRRHRRQTQQTRAAWQRLFSGRSGGSGLHLRKANNPDAVRVIRLGRNSLGHAAIAGKSSGRRFAREGKSRLRLRRLSHNKRYR